MRAGDVCACIRGLSLLTRVQRAESLVRTLDTARGLMRGECLADAKPGAIGSLEIGERGEPVEIVYNAPRTFDGGESFLAKLAQASVHRRKGEPEDVAHDFWRKRHRIGAVLGEPDSLLSGQDFQQ